MAYTTIDDGSAYFQVTTWTGDGSSPRTITNGGNSDLQPDLIWHKNRSDSGRSHYIHDSSRGFGAHHELVPNSDTTENSDSHLTNNHGYIASASTDSFVLGAGATNDNYTNNNTATYVAWQWKANGGTTTTNDASSTGVGGLDSVYQANTTAGFSIVTYTGSGSNTTVAHGLGNVPEVIIFKKRTDDTEDWLVYHHTQGNAAAGKLNSTAAFETGSASLFDSTTPTSSVFSIKTNSKVNDSSDTYVAYCFSEVQGYSRFGSYTGNANVDGPFIYLGFKPKYFLLKCVDATQNWYVFDTARDTYNPSNSAMQASGNTVQETGYAMDFLSNGFKIRHDDGAWNGSGKDFVYMAFAEHPFVSSEGVPVTAR